MLGEIYGRFNERELGFTIRRIQSNLDNKRNFGKAAVYVPERIQFTAANAELLKLLIKPLYGDYREIAVRELVQNAVDACRERHYLRRDERTDLANELRVVVSVKNNDNGTYSLIVEDNGIGMSLDTMKNYFLNAGALFRSSLAWKKAFQAAGGKSEVLRSGRFGVGSLAAFLVADDPTQIRLRVETSGIWMNLLKMGLFLRRL